MISNVALNAAFAIVGGILAAFGLYLVIVAFAALFYDRRHSAKAQEPPRTRVIVLVPAHNEAAAIGECVRLLDRQKYPRSLRHTVVIADNCTDDTAARARAAGAEVLVRDRPDARGKGRALRFAIDRLLAEPARPDAIVVVDADALVEPDLLSALVARFEAGAEVVQGQYLMLEDGSKFTALRTAAFRLVNRVRPSGRAVLGLPCGLAGNGMLFGADVLAKHPWDAFTSVEDAEYGVNLRLAGVCPVFEGSARLASPAPPTPHAARQQQLRWDGGKLHLAGKLVPTLVHQAFRQRRPSLLDAAFELMLPPLGLLAAAALLVAMVGAVLVWSGILAVWAVAPLALTLISIPIHVVVGLWAGGAPASEYAALVRAPLFIAEKALRSHRLLGFRLDSWVRTERPGERRAPGR